MRRLVAAVSVLMLSFAFVGAAALADGVTLPTYERVVLDNGTVLILNRHAEVPLIGLRAILKGGAITDPAGMHGMASLFAALISKGAGDRDAGAFAEAVGGVGGVLTAGAGLEAIEIDGDFLARDADLLVELLSDMLVRPLLDETEFDKLRQRSINLIRAAKDTDLNGLMPDYGAAFLFGEHPYGNPVNGSEETLGNISHEALLAYYEQHIGGDRLIVSVSGDFEPDAMRERLTAAFGGWRQALKPLPEVEAVEPVSGRRVLLIDKPGATQTYFWIANIGVAVDYPSRAVLDLVNTVYGGRFTSMLNTALRIESGLTYGAGSVLTRPSRPGSVAISSYTRTDATVEAIDMALGVLTRLHDEGIDESMIESAQNYLLGQFPTRLETATQLAGQLATLEAYGLDDTYVNAYAAAVTAVDRASVEAVIADVYPPPDDLVFVLLGDAESIRESTGHSIDESIDDTIDDTISKYGVLTEVAITEPRFRIPSSAQQNPE